MLRNRGLLKVENVALVENASNLSLLYHGPFRDAGGYAKMNREIVRQLSALGVNVKTSILPSGRKCAELPIPDIELLSKSPVGKDAPYVAGSLAPGFLNTGHKRNIIFTMMETQTISKRYIDKCNNCDELWLPCDWNFETFKDSGLKRPMYKVPLGVDVDLYNPDVEPMAIKGTEGKFVFLSVFGWSLRKGCDILVRSFARAFANNPHVCLVISSRIWGSEEAGHANLIREDISRFCRQEGISPINNIIHIPHATPEEQMPSLFKAAHCFVLPSRGEGFGLPYAEAGACEVPVIATRHGGQMEFLDDETAEFIDIEGYEKCKNLKLNLVSSYYTDDVLIASLGNNAISALADKMIDITKNYKDAKSKAVKLRQKLTENFTWKHSALAVIKRLNELR